MDDGQDERRHGQESHHRLLKHCLLGKRHQLLSSHHFEAFTEISQPLDVSAAHQGNGQK